MQLENDIVFKTFRTYKHPYLYDRNTNSATVLSDEEYRELRQVERGDMPADQSGVVKRRQAQGLLKPSNVERIEHPETVMTEQYLGTRMRQLTLQVTQQCNLRCGYCVYSGSYVGLLLWSDGLPEACRVPEKASNTNPERPMLCMPGAKVRCNRLS